MSNFPTKDAHDKAELEHRERLASMLKQICPKQTWCQCPVCGTDGYRPNLMALFFNEESERYENSCPDCYTAITLSIIKAPTPAKKVDRRLYDVTPA